MERVDTLIKKLQQQFADGATPQQLMMTVQMLEAELAHLQPAAGDALHVSIDIPKTILPAMSEPAAEPVIAEVLEEEKTVEVLQVDEAEIEAELEEIKRNAEAVQMMSAVNKPQIIFEEEEEVLPTLAHQNGSAVKKEVNDIAAAETAGEKVSLNDKLKQTKLELSDALSDTHIKDLRKAIGVNDRFLYIKELFRGDEAMYERSIKTINSFSILPEAEYWIQRELKVKLGWNDKNETVQEFSQLVKRRFT
jgi:hypothetical protein